MVWLTECLIAYNPIIAHSYRVPDLISPSLQPTPIKKHIIYKSILMTTNRSQRFVALPESLVLLV